MGEQGIKRLITVFDEAMSRVASRQRRVSQPIGDDTKADGAMKNPISATNIQNAYDGEYKIKDIKDNHVQ